MGKMVGYISIDVIYINEYCVEKGDNMGFQSVVVILWDFMVEVVVLEMVWGGILWVGFVFDICDVGVVFNVVVDYFGLGDIDIIE